MGVKKWVKNGQKWTEHDSSRARRSQYIYNVIPFVIEDSLLERFFWCFLGSKIFRFLAKNGSFFDPKMSIFGGICPQWGVPLQRGGPLISLGEAVSTRTGTACTGETDGFGRMGQKGDP